MATFAFHDLENRIDSIQSTRMKTENNPSKPPTQRPVLGVINQNIEKPDHSRKAKNVANQKLGLGLRVQNSKEIGKSIIQQQTKSSSIFTRQSSKPLSNVPFTIHEDDSNDDVTDRAEGVHKTDNEYGNEENEALDEVAMLPQAFCKSKVWKDQEEEEPMSLEKSILSPMSIDLSDTEKSTPTRNIEDMVCMMINADDYRDDIYQYLLQCERRIRPKANYMRKQPDINTEMRSVLVDWLIEVAEEYKMQNETLHLAINYVDRFLSLMSVVRSKLQLLGTAALFVASKYEEIYPPEVGEFVYITDDTYSKKQVLKMETLILKVLNFDLNIPTVHSFICHITVSAHLGPSVLYMAQYFSELALVSGDPFLQFTPSLVACAAIALARYCLEYEHAWPATLAAITGHAYDDLLECVKCLHTVHAKAENSTQKAAYNKYKQNVWNNVSIVEPKTFT
uniref:Cyclin-A1 n=2 Tax=Cacopsylla melanoneura TaxID=428564 RepID=A0A8D8YH62_9HEMI